jgi:soluble lytic murein transglycosylase-like protein
MRKLSLTCLALALCVAPALAQTGASYRFDNFDTKAGVRIKPAPDSIQKSTTKSASSTNKKIAPLSSSAMTVSQSLDGFTTGDAKVDSFIVESSRRNRLDPVLIYAQMHQESSFKKRAVSNKGARGLMQLMPPTAARFGVRDIFDPRQNIEGGARYMRFLLDMFRGDRRLALAAYNAGEGAVLKYGRRVPPYRETQEYVRRITKRYQLMRDPQTARTARKVTPAEVAAVRAEQPLPLTVYERSVFAARLPDGRLRLVSQ